MTVQDVAPRPRLLNRSLVLMFVASAGALGSLYLLFSTVPLYATTGGAGDAGAGLCTGAMMLTTVLAEPLVPRLMRRYGPRAVMVAGLLLLGVPPLALLASSWLPLVLAVCLVRGAGFGIIVVAGTAVVAELAPEGRRSETLGLYGAVIGVPAIIFLPLGVWLTEHTGYEPVFVIGSLLALAVLAAAAGLPSQRAAADAEHGGGLLAALRVGGLTRPALIFGTLTLAAGVLPTFLPLAVADGAEGSRQLAGAALLVQSCATPLTRWLAGWYGTRHRSATLLIPAVALSALGVAALVQVDEPVLVLAGAVLFGAGFGIAQNVTIAVMFERVPRSEFGTVSALWNVAYDIGMGIGAVTFGFIAGGASYGTAFAVLAAVLAAALVPAWFDRRLGRTGDKSRRSPDRGRKEL